MHNILLIRRRFPQRGGLIVALLLLISIGALLGGLSLLLLG